MDYTEYERYMIWLCGAVGIDLKKFWDCIERYGDAGEVFALAKDKDKTELAWLGDAAGELIRTAAESYIDAYIDRLGIDGITVLSQQNGSYPELLFNIPDPPKLLYIKGRADLSPELPLAIVGARTCTNYGKEVALSFGRGLASHGATIISGLARGNDAYAHIGALEAPDAGYPAIAVLGTGVDVVYPCENEKLYARILERGSVVSEFAPGTIAHPQNFPIRNRIISGLALGVIVVEAAERSGTSITARLSLDQGRDVFAVPGRITDIMSYGTNRLIRDGAAKPVFCVEDVLENYGFELVPNVPQKPDFSKLDDESAQICKALELGEMTFDELCEKTALPAGKLSSVLTSLQFRGIINQLPGRIFALRLKK